MREITREYRNIKGVNERKLEIFFYFYVDWQHEEVRGTTKQLN